MKKIIITSFIVFSIWLVACNDDSNNMKASNEESCDKPTIMDPNNTKPMALMMRTMANYCDSMRLKINKGEVVDSVTFPLMPFWTAEPTDSSVLETLFFNNATQFASAWRKLMADTKNQKENYTAVINQCVNCHSSYCSGPLKRIKKLPLDYSE